MRILLTGAAGFLGWHTRVRLRALTDHDVVLATRENWSELPRLADGVDAILHLAGVNRAGPKEVELGNIRLAEDVADAARSAGSEPVLVYANSIHSGSDSPYGSGKETAATRLARAAADTGSVYVDVRLPNLFGEHGRPNYNSFVSTFVRAAITGEHVDITDRPVGLLHAQGAAQALIDGLAETSTGRVDLSGTPTTVQGVFDTLTSFQARYRTGDIPALTDDFHLDLFNTLRAAQFPQHYPLELTPRTDHRGRLVGVVRAHGGAGQTFVSTTRPGVTRGEHFHLRKVERFVVLSGRARISLRRLFTDEVVSFEVRGDAPSIVDMPTMWVHNITNTGDGDVTTLFWTSELFDPDRPDTFSEPVAPVPVESRPSAGSAR